MKKRRKKVDWTDWIHELILGLIPLVLSLGTLYFFRWLNYPVIGILSFIVIITFGLTTFFLFMFRKKQLTIHQFVFSMASVILLTVIIFSFVYTIDGDEENYMIQGGQPYPLSFSDAMYFSVDTITTLGTGDIIPRGYFRFFAMLEVILGLLYLGLFVAGISYVYDQR